jgi:hypothetical protein
MRKNRWKKWTAALALFAILTVPVAALGPEDVESLREIILFLNGKRYKANAIQLNGEYYIPVSLLEETLGASYTMMGTLMRLELGSQENSTSTRKPAQRNTGGGSGGTGSGGSGNTGSGSTSPSSGAPVPQPAYMTGSLRNDLRGLITLLDELEALSDDFQALIYAHTHNITQGKNAAQIVRKMTRMRMEYEEYLVPRYEQMVDEIKRLKLNDRNVNQLVNDLLDDMDEIFEEKEDAMDRVLAWIDGSSTDHNLQVFDQVDRLSNRHISTVRSYVRGALNRLETELDRISR